jgi:hypothetical protein
MKNIRLFIAFALFIPLFACKAPLSPETPPILPPADLPPSPANVRIEASGGDYALRWDTSSGADDYIIYFSSDDTSFAYRATVTTTSYLLPFYGYYKVSAKNSNGESVASASVEHATIIETVATPTLSVAPGDYDSRQEVVIASATADALIYYTLDGSTPSIGVSAEYTSEIAIEPGDSIIITAIAAKAGMSNSDAAVGAYHVRTWETVGNTGFSGAAAIDISLAIDAGGNPVVAFSDASTIPAYKASAMRFDGTAWNVLGTLGFSAGQATWTGIATDTAGNVYVSYKDESLSGKATAQVYNGSSWSIQGSAGFSAGSFIHSSFSVYSVGAQHTPYVAYQDGGNGLKASVMSLQSGIWGIVGTVGFSPGTVDYVSLALGPDGFPYVAFKDNANAGKATVMRLNGSAWEYLGAAGFSVGQASYISLALASDGRAIVAFKDESTSPAGKLSVMEYKDDMWSLIGTAGLSAGVADYVTLSLREDDALFVGYKDAAHGGKASVIKHEGSAWMMLGEAISPGNAEYPRLVLGAEGQPFLAFQDGTNSNKVSLIVFR